MNSLSPCLPHQTAFLRAIAGAALVTFGAACSADRTGPSSEALSAADSAVTAPNDSAAYSPVDSATISSAVSALPGIPFGSTDMPKELLGSVHTGSHVGGALSPSNMLGLLSNARAKGARYVLKMCMGRDQFVKNADGTFSFTKWKALVDRFKTVNFASYISDGTILGHYLIDEPTNAKRWGGKIISQSQIEAMAAYSKKLWPGMPTLVRVVPSWLASSSVTYRHLDAAWLQYASRMGNPTTLVTAEIAAAKRKGLGLVVGLNALDGGNGSSGFHEYSSTKWAMSATELRTYGTALLNQSYVCGFNMWMYKSSYYNRSDVKNAMVALSAKAKAHAKTSCRQ